MLLFFIKLLVRNVNCGEIIKKKLDKFILNIFDCGWWKWIDGVSISVWFVIFSVYFVWVRIIWWIVVMLNNFL